MTQTEIILMNFEEIRRRSLKLWAAIPTEYYSWKPDSHAMSFIEMIRHILEGEHLFHKIVESRGDLGDYISPWQNKSYSSLQNELELSQQYRVAFFETIKSFSPHDFSNVEIIRSEKGQRRLLGDFLQRIAYHESVHTGQLLAYFRLLHLEIPIIWD